jgi:uncharacterized protein
MRRSLIASALVAGTLLVPVSAAAASTDIVISEFRVRGPNGGNDEFIELRNTASTPVNISDWLVRGSNSSGTVGTRATIDDGTTLQPGGVYLLTNSGSSGGPYSGTVTGDQTYGTGITDDGGIAVVRPGGSIADAVGMSTGSAFGEATPLANLGSSNQNRSYERRNKTEDTDVNANDFVLISPSDPQNNGGGPQEPVLTGLRIADIQGAAHVSPVEGALVEDVEGVVTARRNNGFFMQDAEPDSDPATSDGLFVFTSGAPRADIAVGKAVTVSGRVTEFRGAGTALGLTQISAPTVTVVGDGPSIAATVLGEGGRVPPNRVIDNDSLGDVDVNPMFDPDEDGIDFYETVEGMKVQVDDPYVVGPTASFGEIPVVGDGGRFAGPYTARGGLQAVADDFNPERIQLDDEVLRAQSLSMPAANVRDRLSTVQGVVDYSFSNFKVQVLAPPTVTDGGLEKEVTEAPDDDELSVGSFNVENLTPLGANPSAAQRAKYLALAETLVTRMQAPDIVAVEEIQDNNGTSGGTGSPVVDASQTWEDLIGAIVAAGGPTYEYRQIDPVAHQDGGAPGGNIRVGFLFRTDRGLQFVDRPGGTSTNATGVVDTRKGPHLTFSPGRIEPGDDAWLASRKPLAGEFVWRGRTLFAVANHFASKGGDDPLFGHLQPPVRHTENGPDGRHRQATLVNEFVRDLLAADEQARVIVLGDINDFDFSETVDILESGGALTTLFDLLPENERYSYVFEGNSQVLDQILVSPTLLHPSPEYDSVHMNAEFADQTSDHDPQVARLKVTGRLIPQNR